MACLQPFLLIALLQTAPAALPCPPGNVAYGKPVPGERVQGTGSAATDGRLLPEGSQWDQPGTVVLNGQANLTIDLGQPTALKALVLQADNNDRYSLDVAVEAGHWREVWEAAPVIEKPGLRTRSIKLPAGELARWVRVRPSGGDGLYSVSELRAFCQVPVEWPPSLIESPPLTGWNPVAVWRWIDNDRMVAIKGTVAFLGALLLAWGWWRRRRGREDQHRRWRDTLLASIGVFAFFCWWNLFHFHFDNYLHIWEHYHYYLGAKYFPELRYTRLYQCTVVAEMELGLTTRHTHRQIRNLDTNYLEEAQPVLAHPEKCTRHFESQARWEAFKQDVAFLHSQVSRDTWNRMQRDHGYNGTPVWGIVGSILANLAPVGKRWHFGGLAPAGVRCLDILGLLDGILLLGMWGVVCWAFGWRATSVALLYWGTNYPARYWWNGGAFLRMDWLCLAIVGICLVKKEKRFAGGFALTYAALLRIFPGFIVVGLILKVLARMVRERQWVLRPQDWEFAKGCLAAMLVLVPLSAAVAGGWQTLSFDAWTGSHDHDGSVVEQGFIQNSAKHLRTPLTNNMGLKTLVSYQHEQRASLTRNTRLVDPFARWRSARTAAFERRQVLFVLMVVGFLLLLAWAAEKTEDWVALCLGVGLIPIAAELTCYYYSFGLVFGLLWIKREQLGIASCFVSAVTGLIPSLWGWEDERYTWMSLVYVLLAVGMMFYSRCTDPQSGDRLLIHAGIGREDPGLDRSRGSPTHG